MWFIGVEIEQETSAPPPKKNPGSAPELSLQITIMLLPILIFVIQYGRTPFETRKLSAPRRGLCLREVQAYFRFLSVLTAQWVCVGDAYLFFHWLLRSCAGNRVKIRPAKQSHSAAQHITDPVSSTQP